MVLWKNEWKVVEMESTLELSFKFGVQRLFWFFNICLELTTSPERSKLPLCSIPGAVQPLQNPDVFH